MAPPLQTEIRFPSTWGGKRKGAGRRLRRGRGPARHRPRPALASRFPVHVTVRVGRWIRRLRGFRMAAALRQAFARGCEREGFRICQFSIQGNHVHLICEAASADALARGMQGFNVRFARAVNRAMRRRGPVIAERYHEEILRTPQQVRNALCYVMQNARRHGESTAGWVGGVDPFSSARYFDGWQVAPALPALADGLAPVVSPARTWLLTTGWRRRGLIGLDEMPAAGRAREA